MSARCCHVVGDGLGPVGCGVGTLCQLACPSRRPSSSPPRSLWVVVGRSRTATRSHVLVCGEGCLMTLEGCGRHAAGRLRRMRRKKAATVRPTIMSFPPSCQVLGCSMGTRPFRVPGVDSMGRSHFEEPVPYRVAGGAASGGSLVADGYRRAPRLLSALYTSAGDVARVATHGRLASTACKRRLDFSSRDPTIGFSESRRLHA